MSYNKTDDIMSSVIQFVKSYKNKKLVFKSMSSQSNYSITVIDDNNSAFEGERLNMYYIPVEEAVMWEDNPKEHALSDIIRSIRENGFGNPPKWDKNLNHGQGGLVFGNGRTHAIQWMKYNKDDPPKGILINKKTGQWAIPVLFGIDAVSETAAKRFALDDNNLSLMGGSFTAHDISRLYDPDKYMAILDDLDFQNAMPISIDSEDLSALKLAASGEFDDIDGLKNIKSKGNKSSNNSNDDDFEELSSRSVEDRFPVIKARVRPDYYETYLEITADFGETDDERLEGLLSQYVKARKKPYLD